MAVVLPAIGCDVNSFPGGYGVKDTSVEDMASGFGIANLRFLLIIIGYIPTL